MVCILRHFFILVLLATQVLTVEKITVPHDVHPGYSIKKLHSKGELSLVNDDISPPFTLLSDGSLISTKNISHLMDSSIKLWIQEDRDGKTCYQPLVVHVRDRNKLMKFPKSKFYGEILENEPRNTIVDNIGHLVPLNAIGTISYSLSGSSDFDVFHEGNVVAVFTTKPLDKEGQNVYNLVLTATDSKGSSTDVDIEIHVLDVNDNHPVFKRDHYSWNISKELPMYSVIGAVKAVDDDKDRPIYNFVETSPDNAFVIVPQTGDILLMRNPKIGIHSYKVQANDNRPPTFYSDIVPVVITVSENEDNAEKSKILKRSKRAVRQTRAYEHFLESDGRIPGKVMFRLESVHPDEVFTLENESRWIDVDLNGDVKVKERWDYEQLEREKTIDFWVQIKAPQQPEPDRQRIIIHVQDANDENPYFINRPMPMQTIVQLNSPPGTSVFKLQARDPDLDSNIHYYLVRDRTGGRFEVDEISGEVRTVGSDPFMLDQEYVLYVKAEDVNGIKVTGKEQSTGEERLSIIGGKRPPQFFMQSYSATIPENKKKDSEYDYISSNYN